MIRIPDSKIEKAVAKDGVRTYLNAPYFTGKGIVATDGRILAYVPVIHDNGDIEGHIPLDVFKQARKAKSLDIDHTGSGHWLAAGASFPNPDLGKYPNWGQVTERPLDNAAKAEHSTSIISIALDARLLFDLAQALTTKPAQPIVRLTIDTADELYANAAIHVEAAATDAGAFGVIMPCKFRD